MCYLCHYQDWKKKRYTYSVASIKTDVHNSLKKDKIGFWKLEGLEFGSEQISIFGEEVFKQHRVYSTSEMKKKVVGDDYHNDLFDGKKCNGCEINSVFFQDLEPHLKFTIGVVTHYMPNAKIAISCTSSSRNSSILLYLCCRRLFKDSHVF